MLVEELIEEVLRKEGGYSNHPSDRGGPTKFGITQQTLSTWLGRSVGADEVRALDVETAREIYERNYYAAPRIDTLPEEIQPIVFDCAVNHGPRRAITFVQKVLNEAGFGPVDVDGTIGPQTREAAEEAQQAMGGFFCNAIVEERLAFYDRLAFDRTQAPFLRGWRLRAESFRVPV